MSEGLVGIIGGTGLGDALAESLEDVEYKEVSTPFGSPSGSIAVGRMAGRRAAFLSRHGEGHRYNPSMVPYRANIFALKSLGVKSIIAGGAVGSLREEIGPKDLVVADQFIDKTYRRRGSFFDDLGAVHCEFSEPCCGGLREAVIACEDKVKSKVHSRGTYVCMEGPAFSTKAESLMHRQWGGDLIGMTAMPEAKLAREAQISYALVALVSDYDCWREADEAKDKQTLIEEIIGNLTTATNNAIELIRAVLESGAELINDEWPARKSLDMAVWTKPEVIDAEEKEKLRVLFE